MTTTTTLATYPPALADSARRIVERDGNVQVWLAAVESAGLSRLAGLHGRTGDTRFSGDALVRVLRAHGDAVLDLRGESPWISGQDIANRACVTRATVAAVRHWAERHGFLARVAGRVGDVRGLRYRLALPPSWHTLADRIVAGDAE